MPESVDIDLKRTAIMLADELSYTRAAKRLNIAPAELRTQIVALETKLSIRLFEADHESLELTEEGRALIGAFRKAIALHDKEPLDSTERHQD